MTKFASFVVVLLVVSVARAERPPQSREKADLMVAGKVTKLMAKDAAFGGDGVMTTYTATVKVDEVEKGEAKASDTVDVTWFRVTKRPTRPIVGAFGQDHKLKEKDAAKFWLMKGKDRWSVIYNSKGVEKVKE